MKKKPGILTSSSGVPHVVLLECTVTSGVLLLTLLFFFFLINFNRKIKVSLVMERVFIEAITEVKTEATVF